MSNPEEGKSQGQAEPLVFEEEEEQDANFNEEEHFNEEEQVDNFNEEEQEAESISKISFEISSSIEKTSNEVFPYLISDLHTCRGYYFNFDFDELNLSKITFRIPTTILPLSVSVVNGFYDSPYLIECKIEFIPTQSLYKQTPYSYTFTNPSYGELFPGSILVKNRFRNFFSTGYEPSTQYRCQNYILAPQVSADKDKIDSLLKTLVDEGFPAKKAENALIFCSYNLSKARDYLLSGLLEQESFTLPVKYNECPLFYLILEICESFFDIGDCCCVCGKKLGVTNLKPSCCEDKQCQFSFLNLGVGSNIIGDIKRDHLATDLVISLAGAAYYSSQNNGVNAFDPSPESQGIKMPKDFFTRLPSMRSICMSCQNDGELKELIGEKYFEVLRFFILANKAQLMTLPGDLRTSIDTKSVQFLVTSVTPESELVFRKKREQYGVRWFWHGSGADRWYRILHTGLKNMAGSKFQANGGDGIFMSDSFLYSLGYCRFVPNAYKHSELPKKLLVISLLENANVPELRFYVSNEYTQHDESASITRVLFVIGVEQEDQLGNYYYYNKRNNCDYNVVQNPPKVPTLHEVITHQMKKYI